MTGVFYDWQTADRAARTRGHRVRRRGWTTKWLRWLGGLWWMLEDGEAARVVQADDFGRDEFLAADWTHMPVACITEVETQTGTTCPAPFAPVDPGTVSAAASVSSAGGAVSSAGGAVSSARGGSPVSGFAGGPVGGGDPPPATYGPIGGGGGGSLKKADFVWPELSIGGITDDSVGDCYEGEAGDGTRYAPFSGTIELSAPADVVPGPYKVYIRRGPQVLWTAIMSPGDSESFAVTGLGTPGSTVFSFEARAWGPFNAPDITASVDSPMMKNWCGGGSGTPIGEP